MVTILIIIGIVVVLAGAGVVVTKRRSSPALGAGTPAPQRIEPAAVAPVVLDTTTDAVPADVAVVEGAPVAPVVTPADELSESTPPSVGAASAKSRGIFAGLRAARRLKAIEPSTWDELESSLLRGDVGVTTTTRLLETLRAEVAAGTVTDGSGLLERLRSLLIATLSQVERPEHGELSLEVAAGRVPVWLLVGVNGVGKTTTIGKLAYRAGGEGKKVLLAAGDTFRAAAGEQLATWGARSEVDVVLGAAGADPSAVIFDAVQRAGARGFDVVIADTAGRLHNKVNLVEELKKIRRVADREPGQVTAVLLVIDATTGQNALQQARQFTEAVSVTGIVLSKFDGSARGGVVVAIEAELKIPVRFLGVGEHASDLIAFEPIAFVDALLADDPVA